MAQKVAKKVTKVAAEVVELAPANSTQSQPIDGKAVQAELAKVEQKVLYVKITTMDVKGAVIGERIVDMYHFGTRKWLHDHTWWAMHNDHLVEQQQASVTDVEVYLATQRQKLADKFNTPKAA